MFILVTGGSKSGRSAAAEKITVSSGLPLFYIATMIPYGEEGRETVERHRKMRYGKGFHTIEKYTNIAETDIPEKSAVLLECVGNLCANEMFSFGCKDPSGTILRDIDELNRKTRMLVAVTSQVGSDGTVYERETMEYIAQLGTLNRNLAELADCVIESVFGIPLILKGERPECL